MADIYITKMIIKIRSGCKQRGERILSSSLLDAEQIKPSLRSAAQQALIADEMKISQWVINLGVIPAYQFDTAFIPRLIQAFGERLALEQASQAWKEEVRLPSSEVAVPGRSASEPHPQDPPLFRFACRCLTQKSFETLLQASPVVELQGWLKQLLEGSYSSPGGLPSIWYNRFTASRLSIAAALYLLNNTKGRDWLGRSRPSASQLADWANAIGQREIPAEQVTQLLFASPPSGSLLTKQRNPSPLLVMRWLLPVWQQPAIRRFVHQQEGPKGVLQIETFLRRCVLRPNPGKSLAQETHAGNRLPGQIADQYRSAQDKGALAYSQRTSLQNAGRKTDFSPERWPKNLLGLPQDWSASAREHPSSLQNAGRKTDFSPERWPKNLLGLSQDGGASARKHPSSLQNAGRMTDFAPESWPKTPFRLPQGEGVLAPGRSAPMPSAGRSVNFLQSTSERDSATIARSKSMVTDPRQDRQADAYAVSSVGKKRNKPLPRWHSRPWADRSAADEQTAMNQQIDNAGLMLLWPLFPKLFSRLNLWEEDRFISDSARWQAMYCLDWLAWGNAVVTPERLILNQLLCGVSLLTDASQVDAVTPLQQKDMDDWLIAIGQQLAGWQKLSLTDIRQLFLQRRGEISTEGAFPKITVKSEPYDYLLRDWPWPMTLAALPWTQHPLTIVWRLNNGAA